MIQTVTSLFFCVLLLSGCQPNNETPTAEAAPVEATPGEPSMDALDKALAAHGGLDTWRSMGTLEYNVFKGDREEHHLVDLQSRNILHAGTSYAFGYDGADVWVSPTRDAYPGNPRFANGLDFYFFGIPFVLADPGTNREYLGQTTVNGVDYETVKISFDAGTGGSPDDYYIAHFDPESHQLHSILYTVTFNSQTPNEQYYARMYDTWEEIDGLLLPTKMTAYAWDGETRTTGEMYRETTFSDIKLSTASPDPAIFAIPENAELALPDEE